MTLVVAHAGHWLADLAYLLPLLVLLGFVLSAKLKERHGDDDE